MDSSRQRRSLRLPAYDYSGYGAYFFTIVTAERRTLFGRVIADEVRLTSAGEAVTAVWHELPRRFQRIEMDAFLVMPNHVHGILWLLDRGECDERGAASSAPTLGDVLRAFKSLSARHVNKLNRTSGAIWQRNYFERVVRNETELSAFRRYIAENPLRWALDHENPERSGL